MMMMRAVLLLLAPLLFAGGVAPAAMAQPVPGAAVADVLESAGPGTRIGLVVVDEDGREVVAVRPDDRFVPASNTKMYTTAAAFALLETAAPDAAGGASVRLEGRGSAPDVVLAGHGDARLSSAPIAWLIAWPSWPRPSPRRPGWSATSSATTPPSPMNAGRRG